MNNKITLSNLKNLTKEEINSLKAHDEILVNDFILSMENDYNTCKRLENISNNYSKKINKGVFNYALGVKGLLPVIEYFGKEYIKQYCPKNTKYTTLVSINDRIIIACNLLNNILEDLKEE